MKSFWQLILLSSVLGLTGCGGKNAQSEADLVTKKYALQPFHDINKASTLKLDELQNLVRKIDLKDDMTSVKQQDERGTCSFFASIALVEAAIKRKMKVEVNLSEEYLNNVVKSSGLNSKDEGGFPTQNLYVAINKEAGFLLERDWPYQPSWFENKSPCKEFLGSDASAPAECFSHNSPPESVLAKKIPGSSFKGYMVQAETTNAVIVELATHQVPMTVTVPVNDRGWTKDGNIQYDEEMRNECITTPSVCGQHVVVLTGYDLDKKVFFFKNSWGKGWGNEGYGTMPFDVIDRHVSKSFVEVELEKDIDLPKDYNVDYFTFVDLKVNSKLNADNSIVLKILGNIQKTQAHTIQVSSTLVEMDANCIDLPSEINTIAIHLNAEEEKVVKLNYVTQKNLLIASQDQVNIVWDDSAPLMLNISQLQMQQPTVVNELNSSSKKVFIRTTLYTYSDDASFKVLKRVYQPLNYNN